MNNIYIRKISLPPNVRGVTIKDHEDNYNVYVNTNLCQKSLEATIAHEMCHIKNNHFYNDQTAIQSEKEVERAQQQ